MDLLKEWMGSTIARELNTALQWRISKPTHVRHSENYRYQDDGSNLRAKGSKPGIVQIMKLRSIEGPVEAWISDSTFRLKATIAAAAVQKFFLHSRKKITRDTLGGLFQLLDFEIVATHLGPRDSRLTLLINDFKSLGAEGSGLFGNPRPIEVNQEIVNLLDELKVLRGKESAARGQRKWERDVDNESSHHSQSDGDISSDDSLMASQQALSTQVTHRHLKNATKVTKPKTQFQTSSKVNLIKCAAHLEKSTNLPVKDLSEKAKTKAIEEGASSIQPSCHLAEETLEVDVNESKKPDNAAALLSLLSRNKPIAQPELANKDTNSSGELTPKSENDKEAKKVEQLEVMHQSARRMIVEQVPATRAIEKDELSQEEDASPSTSVHNGRSFVEKINGSEELVSNNNLNLTFSSVFDRISGRDVKIEKDQQVLLDRPDSWIPAEPGQRLPVANVPIKTLQAFNDLAERRTTPSPKQTQSASDSGSSVSWSSSPVREQLPPDSSVDMQVDVQEETEQESQTKKRRPLDSSISPRSGASVRKSSSHTWSSPSAISSTSSGGLRPFGCPINGCNKSYKRPRTLQLHTKYRHGDATPPRTTSGTHSPDLEYSPNPTDKRHSCSDDSSANPAIFKKIGDDNSYPELQSQIASSLLRDLRSIQSGQLQQKTEGNLNLRIERQNGCLLENSSNIPLSQSEVPIDILGDTPTSNSIILTKQQSAFILPGQPNVVNLNTDDQSASISDAEPPSPEETPHSSHANGATVQQFPSTAFQPEEPVLQVKRTPYVNGHISKSAIHIVPQNPVVFDVSSADSSSSSTKQSEEEFHGPETMDEDSIAEKVQHEIDSQSPTHLNVSQIEDTFLSADQENTKKRKFSGLDSLLPNLTKRRCNLKIFDSLKLTQVHQDPSIIGRQFRQEFLASRKSLKSREGEFPQTYLKEGSLGPQVTNEKTNNSLEKNTDDSGERQQSTNISPVPVGCVQPSVVIDLYDRFKLAYPEFAGNLKQFAAICGKIRDLVKAGRGEHPALWDDFIIRHSTEYPRYLSRCTNDAEDPLPYDQFYRSHVEEARYFKQIITRKTLNDALALKRQISNDPSTEQQGEYLSDDTHNSVNLGTQPPKSVKNSPPAPPQMLSQTTTDVSSSYNESSQHCFLPHVEKRIARSLPWVAPETPNTRQDSPAMPRVLPRTDRLGLHSRSSHSIQTNTASCRQSLNISPSEFDTKKTTAPKRSMHDLKPPSRTPSQESSHAMNPAAVDLDTAVPPKLAKGPKANDETPNDAQIEDSALDGLDALVVSDEWWKDENSPFKRFVRAYEAIQPGRGNSYARVEPKAESNVEVGKMEIDFLNWYF